MPLIVSQASVSASAGALVKQGLFFTPRHFEQPFSFETSSFENQKLSMCTFSKNWLLYFKKFKFQNP